MAQICHEVNRSYCRAINDHSQLSWEETPEHIKESARTGVIMHLLGDVTPEQSHANWMEYKREEGWVYGPEKDVEAKVHPCMVPYNELPLEQQVKDHLFKGVVNSVSKVFSCAPQMATLKLLTFCVLVLRNGFTVTGESACASPENFDAELGRSIARAKAKEKMWPLLGYALKSKLYSK